MTQSQFAAMLQDLHVSLPSMPQPTAAPLDAKRQFEAGMLFEQYDVDKSGRISQDAFQRIYQDLLEAKPSSKSHSMATPGREIDSWPPYTAAMFPHSSVPDTRPPQQTSATATATIKPSSSEARPLFSSATHDSTNSDDDDYIQHHTYKSPLPYLSALPVEYGDSATALLRRDFLHLQTLLEATLAPRIESEVHVLEQVHRAKVELDSRAKKIEDATRAEAESIIKQLQSAKGSLHAKLEELANTHRKVLEKMGQFQYLAAGPRPRDALRMDPYGLTQYSSAMAVGLPSPAEASGAEDPALAVFRRQRMRAQAAFRDQERFPHPVIMRDFVNLFKEFQAAAQKLVDAPYVGLTYKPDDEEGSTPVDKIKKLANEPLPKEIDRLRSMATEAAKLKEQVQLKDQMIFTLVQERESFEQQKQEFLAEVDELSDVSTKEIRAWAQLHEQSTRELQEKIALLQEQNRNLQEQLRSR